MTEKKSMHGFLRRDTFQLLSLLLIVGSNFEPVLSDIVQNISSKGFRLVEKDELKIHTCCPLDLNSRGMVSCNKKHSPDDKFIPSESLFVPLHLMAENVSTTFQLSVKKAPCVETAWDKVYLNIQGPQGRGSLFLRNGYLKIESEYFHMDEYCIYGKNNSMLEINVCPQNCKGPRPCIVKCCGLDKVYSFGFTPNGTRKGCQNPDDEYFSPTLYADFNHKSSNPGALAPHFIEKYPSTFKYQCHNNITSIIVFESTSEVIANMTGFNMTGHPFRVREDGMFLYKEADGKCSVIDPLTMNICIDGIISYGPESPPFRNDPEAMVIFLCSLPPREGEEEFGSYLYGSLMIGSSVFLLLTIAVYFMLWERQTVHGWTILSHTISLFFMYIFLGTSHLLRVTKGHSILNTKSCFAVGVLAHFFFLSTFCWLSMISIDLWLTFRAITPRRGTKSKGLKRYTLYSVLGWGIPAIIVATGWILSKEDPAATCSTVIIPGYGIQSCYLQDKALGVYLYYPIAVMMTLNILFFTVTSVKLYMYRNSTKMATKDDTQQQFYRLFVKLFFVMGILYNFELISWAVSGAGVHWTWVTFDILNILRAVAVFIIFVCKPDIIWALEQNYSWLKPLLIPCACIVQQKRSFHQRNAESESVGLQTSMSTKQSMIRSSTSTTNSRSTIRRD